MTAIPPGDDEGYEPFIVAEGWREDAEIRFVPESAVAEAVAAERARIAAYVLLLNPLRFLRDHDLEPGAGTAQVLAALSAEITEGSG